MKVSEEEYQKASAIVEQYLKERRKCITSGSYVTDIDYITSKLIPPKYISLGLKGIKMYLDRDVYRVPYGAWGVSFKLENGKLISMHELEHLNNLEILEITEEEFSKWDSI